MAVVSAEQLAVFAVPVLVLVLVLSGLWWRYSQGWLPLDIFRGAWVLPFHLLGRQQYRSSEAN